MAIRYRLLLVFPLLAATALVDAANTVRLPSSFCSAGAIFADGFERLAAIPHAPSIGRGGAFPGDVTRTISLGAGTRSTYLRLPSGYTPTRAWPLLLALHGSTGSAATAATAAQQVRRDWAGWADSQGFVVLAVVGSQAQGGWGAPSDGAELGAALDDALAAYNIERSRIYLWGFSAGAHFGHALALNNPDYFAAYGVSAGALEQYACSDSGAYPPSCSALLAGTRPKIPVDIHLGSSDPLYVSYGAGNDAARFRNGGWVDGQNLYYTLFSGGHSYTVAQLGDIWNHLCPFALGP